MDRYISSELPVFFELRVQYLLACERVSEAMSLARCCSRHPTAGQHLFFLQVYLTWLCKTSQYEHLHKEVSGTLVASMVFHYVISSPLHHLGRQTTGDYSSMKTMSFHCGFIMALWRFGRHFMTRHENTEYRLLILNPIIDCSKSAFIANIWYWVTPIHFSGIWGCRVDFAS